jgi:uncharacterized protein YndB with AHSA1/START domain
MSYSATIERTIPASRERVWTALTSDELAAWFWPQRFETTVQLDLRVGGAYRIDGPGAGMAVSGVFVAVEAPERLVQTWRWDGEDAETLVTITLAETSDGSTALRIVHENFADEQSCSAHVQGWNDCLDRLVAAAL